MVACFLMRGLCATCGTYTVEPLGEDPPGFALHRCSSCHLQRRACPRCGGQGWLDRYRRPDGGVRYVCDGCQSVWDGEWTCLTPDGVPASWKETVGDEARRWPEVDLPE